MSTMSHCFPSCAGTGAAGLAVAQVLARAGKEKLTTVSLVAVNESAGFWGRHGFRGIKIRDAALARRLRDYSNAAAFMVREL
jgi:hypothetical protein